MTGPVPDPPAVDYSALAGAVLGAVAAAVPEHVVVTLNGKPDRPNTLDAYVVVWCGESGRSAVAWNGRADTGQVRWMVQTVGFEPETCAWLAGRLVEHLTSARITGAQGWRFRRATFVYGQNPYVDETITGQPNVSKADTFTADITRV